MSARALFNKGRKALDRAGNALIAGNCGRADEAYRDVNWAVSELAVLGYNNEPQFIRLWREHNKLKDAIDSKCRDGLGAGLLFKGAKRRTFQIRVKGATKNAKRAAARYRVQALRCRPALIPNETICDVPCRYQARASRWFADNPGPQKAYRGFAPGTILYTTAGTDCGAGEMLAGTSSRRRRRGKKRRR